jgi:hypothetical protein
MRGRHFTAKPCGSEPAILGSGVFTLVVAIHGSIEGGSPEANTCSQTGLAAPTPVDSPVWPAA